MAPRDSWSLHFGTRLFLLRGYPRITESIMRLINHEVWDALEMIKILRHQCDIVVKRSNSDHDISIADELSSRSQVTSDPSKILHAIFSQRKDRGCFQKGAEYLLLQFGVFSV